MRWTALAAAAVAVGAAAVAGGHLARRRAAKRARAPPPAQLPRRRWPGRAAFYREHVDPAVPALLQGAAAHWGGTRWTLDFLRARPRLCAAVVDVAVSNEERERTRKLRMSLGEALARVAAADLNPPGNDPVPYVKQLDVARLDPELAAADLDCASFFSARTVFGTHCFWVGAAGAVTGLHSDDENNVLVVLQGVKRVLLYPPAMEPLMRVNGKYDSGTQCCDLDPEAPGAPQPQLVADVGPGDVLFIPRYWFHQVRTVEGPSVSVNYFASTPAEMLFEGAVRGLFSALHWAGVWGRGAGGCVCHSS